MSTRKAPRWREVKNGETYGKFTVVKEVEPKIVNDPARNRVVKVRQFAVRCDCGTEKVLRGSMFLNGHTKSCGCLVKLGHTENVAGRLAKGRSAFNSVMWCYRSGAGRRDLEFSLTEDQFRFIATQPCSYCGSHLTQSYPPATQGLGGYNGRWEYTGIDRKDNNLGYTVENSVPCCGKCNFSKHRQTEEEFYAWISRAHSHLVSIGKISRTLE